MTLSLYDTVTREVRDFVPLEEGKAGIYVCGLTVQSEPHVGHVRSAVNFDVLRRWLTPPRLRRHVHPQRHRHRRQDPGEVGRAGPAVVQPRLRHERASSTRRYEALNVLPPTYEPAATGHVPEMLELIASLIDRGHAYAAEDGSGDVYFDVRSWPAYGELTNQRIDDMEPAEDADPRGKRDPRDFALWKGWKKESEPETAAWPSPWGPGRPGWHIECSAMAGKYLGRAFDIHGGGVDLRFPHHENEQAQSRAAGYAVRVVLDAQRLDHHRRREDEQVARQLAADPRGAQAGARRSSCASTSWPRTTARHVEFSLRGARRGRRRVPPDRELPRPRGRDRLGRRAADDPSHCPSAAPGRVRGRDGRRPRRPRPRSRCSTTPCARATSCWPTGPAPG